MSFLDPGSVSFRIWRLGLVLILVYILLGWATSRLAGDPLAGRGVEDAVGRVVAAGVRAESVAVEVAQGGTGAEAGAEGARTPVGPTPARTVVRGALSVHSGRSHDAEGSLEEVAAAAAEAGLDFVLLGDHPRGDWYLQPDAFEPRRIDGVHLSQGTELLVAHVGRTLAVGLDSVPDLWWDSAGLPSLGEVADEDGAFVSIVHPRSPRWGESWKSPSVRGAHAFESFDVSEMARKRLASVWGPYHLVSFLVGTISDRTDESYVRLWRERSRTPALLAYDSLRAEGPLVLTGGLNHHPKLRTALGLFPGYLPAFRTVVNHLALDAPLPEDPVAAQAVLLEALRRGDLYVSLGWPEEAEGFRFRSRSAPQGGTSPLGPGETLSVDLPAAPDDPLLVHLLRDGRTVEWIAADPGARVEWDVSEPGVYRVEVHRAGIDLGPLRLGRAPWLFSNPIQFTR